MGKDDRPAVDSGSTRNANSNVILVLPVSRSERPPCCEFRTAHDTTELSRLQRCSINRPGHRLLSMQWDDAKGHDSRSTANVITQFFVPETITLHLIPLEIIVAETMRVTFHVPVMHARGTSSRTDPQNILFFPLLVDYLSTKAYYHTGSGPIVHLSEEF